MDAADLPERPLVEEVELPASLRSPEPRHAYHAVDSRSETLESPGFSEQASWFGSPELAAPRRMSHFGGDAGSRTHGVELSPAGLALLRGATPNTKRSVAKRRQRRSDRLFVTGDPEDLRHILRDARVLNDARERAKNRADASLRPVIEDLRQTIATADFSAEERLAARKRVLALGLRFLEASVLENDIQHHTKLVEIVEELLHLRALESKYCTLVLFAISPYSRRALAIEALSDDEHARLLASPRNICSTSCNFEPFTPSRPPIGSPGTPSSLGAGAKGSHARTAAAAAASRGNEVGLHHADDFAKAVDEYHDDDVLSVAPSVAEIFERDLLGFHDRLQELQRQIEAKQIAPLSLTSSLYEDRVALTPSSSPAAPSPSRKHKIRPLHGVMSPLPRTPSRVRASPSTGQMTTPVSQRPDRRRSSSSKKSVNSRSSLGPKGIRCRICEEVVPRALATSHFESCLESYKDIYRECRLESLASSLRRARTRTRSEQELEELSAKDYNTFLDNIAKGIDLVLEARAAEDLDQGATVRQQLLIRAQEALAEVLDGLGKSPVFGSLKALAVEALDAAIAQAAVAQTPRSHRSFSVPKRPRKTSPKDFDFTKTISRGSVGRVFLAIKRGTGDVYAVKVMDKAEVVRKNLAARIVAERNVMARADCPFVVKLFFSFETRTRLFLAMEFVQGGDILALLNTYGVIPEGAVRWYASEIVVALKYLHERLNVCHRDLKPDNILIGRDGHIKLTDFGLSHIGIVQGLDATALIPASLVARDTQGLQDEENAGVSSSQSLTGHVRKGTGLLAGARPAALGACKQTSTPASADAASTRRRMMRSQVGTPDYMAPEILLGTGHGFACDWWSLGIIIYEMLFGMPPFNDETPQRIFHNILSGELPPEEARAPVTASSTAWDLLDQLLQTSASHRLGAGGAVEVQQHAFFEGVSWASLESGEFAASDEAVPFIPAVSSEMDTKYFASATPPAPSIPTPHPPSPSMDDCGDAALFADDPDVSGGPRILDDDDDDKNRVRPPPESEGNPSLRLFDDDDDEDDQEGGMVDLGDTNACARDAASEGAGDNASEQSLQNHSTPTERVSIFPEIDFACSQPSHLQKLNMAAVEDDQDDFAGEVDQDDSDGDWIDERYEDDVVDARARPAAQ